MQQGPIYAVSAQLVDARTGDSLFTITEAASELNEVLEVLQRVTRRVRYGIG